MCDGLLFYRNRPIIKGYLDFIDNSPNGVICNDICAMFGENTKGTTRMLKKAEALFPNKYSIHKEVINKSGTFRFFTKENYEKFNKVKKLKLEGKLKGDENGLENLSTQDRKELILKMIEKYEVFVFDILITREMKELIGYKLNFDRKNFIKIARKMKEINIYDVVENGFTKVIAAKKDLLYNNPRVQNLISSISLTDKNYNPFQVKLKHFILSRETFILHDNGYPTSKILCIKNFYNFLKRVYYNNNNMLLLGNIDGKGVSINEVEEDTVKEKPEMIFDGDLIKKMTVNEFLGINRVYKTHFKQLLGIKLYNRTEESISKIFGDKKFNVIQSDCNIINKLDYSSDIKELANITGNLRIDEMFIFNDNIFYSIRKKLNPNTYISFLTTLSKLGLIEYTKNEEVNNKSRENNLKLENIKIKILKNEVRENEFVDHYPIPHCNLKERVEFFNEIVHFEEHNFLEKVVSFISSKYKNDEYKKKFFYYLIQSFSCKYMGIKILNSEKSIGLEINKTSMVIKNTSGRSKNKKINQKLYKIIKYFVMNGISMRRDLINRFFSQNDINSDNLNNLTNSNNLNNLDKSSNLNNLENLEKFGSLNNSNNLNNLDKSSNLDNSDNSDNLFYRNNSIDNDYEPDYSVDIHESEINDVLIYLKENNIIGRVFNATSPTKITLSSEYRKKFLFGSISGSDYNFNHEAFTKPGLSNFQVKSSKNNLNGKLPYSDLNYYSTIYDKIHKTVTELKSVDFNELKKRLKFLELFEIQEFFKIFENKFIVMEFEGIFIVSIKDNKQTFDINSIL